MTNKPSTATKSKKTSRLGHDPFLDDDISADDKEIAPSPNEELNKKFTETKNECETLDLPPRFCIASVEEVYDRMSSLLTKEQNCIILNPETTESVDTAAIQMLCAFTLQANISNINIQWKSHSKVIDDAARMLGVNVLENTD